MSETVDVNVLIYARNADSPFHADCANVVERLAAGPAVAYLLQPVLMSYVRIVTNPRLIQFARTHAEAVGDLQALIDRPNLRVVGPGDQFWPMYLRATQSLRMTSKLVADAQSVALMYEHGIGTIWTRDRDFRVFDGITAKDPSAQKS